jgi:acetolactate synthase-1/2/3 large subunit
MRYEPIEAERKVAHAVVEALAQAGIRFVLGMPGGLTGPLWRALYQHPTIRAVQVREESIGSQMAEAYGRLTGEPLVVMGQGEWIVGNAGQGYLEALLGSCPIVILTDMSDGATLSHHGPYQSGSGDYGTWDARTALLGLTKRVMVCHDPVQAVQLTQLALKHAMTGQPGPVAVVYRTSSLKGVIGPSSFPVIYPTSAYLPKRSNSFDPEAVRWAAEALRDAQRPVVIAGNGVRVAQAAENLARFASITGFPVATTASGKGVFPETDPLALGPIGVFGWATANEVVGNSDLVLAVGSKLGPGDTLDENRMLLDPARQTLIQIDIEPLNAAWTYPIDQVILGDAGVILDRLGEAYAEITPGSSTLSSGVARVDEARRRFGQFDTPDAGSESLPLAPQRIIKVLEETFPSDGVITCDAGENRLFMMQWYRSKQGGDYLQPAAGGGMGYAVPAAMAVKLAFPDRSALAVCGDGGFAMSVHALMSAVQERLPIGVLVLNNGALGWVLHGMGDKAVAANFVDFDYAAVARSLGCGGVRVASSVELRVALERVSHLDEPLVIEVPTSLATSFQDVRFTPDRFAPRTERV